MILLELSSKPCQVGRPCIVCHATTWNRAGRKHSSRLALALTKTCTTQTGAVLEILHVLWKVVPGKVGVVGPQVFSRIVLVWWVCARTPDACINHPEFWLMAFAWGITECIR